MSIWAGRVALIHVGLSCLYAQGDGARKAFEIATVKPSATLVAGMSVRSRGGPGTSDPTLYSCENCSLSSLLKTAYNRNPHEVSYPGWMDSATFDVTARVPANSTKDDFRIMLQSLLAERFRLKTHTEVREIPIYLLVIGKNGPKMHHSRQAAEGAGASASPGSQTAGPPSMALATDGYPDIPRGRNISMMIVGGRARLIGQKESMDKLAERLTSQMDYPVVNKTGLNGEYDFSLFWDADQGRSAPRGDGVTLEIGPTIPDALREQLGLVLVAGKKSTDVLFVDSVQRDPGQN